MIFAILGTISHPFYFSFHTSIVLTRYPILENVLRSVWDPRKKLLNSILFMLYAIYIFSIFAFVYFYEDFNYRKTKDIGAS